MHDGKGGGEYTIGPSESQTGKLNGLIERMTPLGSLRMTGLMAAKLMLNGAFSVRAHLSTRS